MFLCRRRRRGLCRMCRRLEHCSEKVSSSSGYSPCTMLQRFVLYQTRTCPPGKTSMSSMWWRLVSVNTCLKHSWCMGLIPLHPCTCLMGKLCMFLCRRCPSSLHHKCRRLEHCSEKARSSSGYMMCRMFHRILLFPPGTCPRRRPCRMLQQFVL